MPWYHKLGWRSNPFDYRPSAEFFMFADLFREVMDYIDSGSVISTYGIAGMGKTSLLYYLYDVLDPKYYIPIFLDMREIRDVDTFYSVMRKQLLAYGDVFTKLLDMFRPNYDLFDFKKIIGRRKLVLLVDEVGLLKNDEIASLFATIKDNINSSIVTTSIEPLSNYSIFKSSFRDGRVAREIAFPIPTDDLILNMVNGRIKRVGGRDLYPFEEEALRYIIHLSGNIPRETLIGCQNAVIYYINEDLGHRLTKRDLEVLFSGMQHESKEIDDGEDLRHIYNKLSDNQRKIVNAIVEPKTARELSKELGISYGSITKELGRLMLQTDVDMMFRKGLKAPICIKTINRPYKFVLTKKWRLYLTKE